MSEIYVSSVMYLCEPEKNIGCHKTYCQTECFHCREREFSKDGKPGPVCTKLYENLRAIQYGDAPDLYGWVTVLDIELLWEKES